MPDLLILGRITPEMEAHLAAHFALHWYDRMDDPKAWLAANGATVDYVLTNGGRGISTADVKQMPNLRLISNYGVGYDGIDAQAAAQSGILVTHTPDVLNAEVATTALLLMMACYRELLRDDAWVRSGSWTETGNSPLTRTVDGQRVGIVGMGRIGQEIARKLAPFDPTIHYHARSERNVPHIFEPDLVEMARKVDCLIVITPGGPQTRHLINGSVIKALGPQGTLINVARGSVVDETAMIAALQSGDLGWAGLDVFEAEPSVPDVLRALPNVVLLPHVGSATVETRAAMGKLTAVNLIQHATDETVQTPVPESMAILPG